MHRVIASIKEVDRQNTILLYMMKQWHEGTLSTEALLERLKHWEQEMA